MNNKTKQEVIRRLSAMLQGYNKVIEDKQGNALQRKALKLDIKKLEKLIEDVKKE